MNCGWSICLNNAETVKMHLNIVRIKLELWLCTNATIINIAESCE